MPTAEAASRPRQTRTYLSDQEQEREAVQKFAAVLRGIDLEVSDEARAFIAREGYDPVYGARPLKRVIQKAVQDPLAEKLLGGEILDGAVVPTREHVQLALYFKTTVTT